MVKNLKKLRMEKGMSQQALAARLGISQQSVNKYENHSIEPDIATLIAMADLFAVSVDHLIGRAEAPNNQNLSQPALWEQRYHKLTPKEQQAVEALLTILTTEA